MKLIGVTGCLGFIGGHVTRALLDRGDRVLGIDAVTYAANTELVPEFRRNQNFTLWERDIVTLDRLPQMDALVHLAAETHVDNSIADPGAFIRTNIQGTFNLLELIRGKRHYERPLLVHVSTDEVYGDSYTGKAVEETPFHPSSPYAASKAAGEHLVVGYGRTFGLVYKVVRPSNCYGEGQYREKLIPKALDCLRRGQPIPIHGDGSQERSWLAVEDCAEAILTVLDQGHDGEAYNVGGNHTGRIDELVGYLVGITGARWDQISFGHERPGQDRRYEVDDTKLRNLGWTPKGSLFRDLDDLAVEPTTFRW